MWLLRNHCAQKKRIDPETLLYFKFEEEKPDVHGVSSEVLRGCRYLCLRSSHARINERKALLHAEPGTLFSEMEEEPLTRPMGIQDMESWESDVDLRSVRQLVERMNDPLLWSQLSKAVAECFEIIGLESPEAIPEVIFRAGCSRAVLLRIWQGVLYPLLRVVSDFKKFEAQEQTTLDEKEAPLPMVSDSAPPQAVQG
jgi:hypothetical protein